jgi:hypothetical protein
MSTSREMAPPFRYAPSSNPGGTRGEGGVENKRRCRLRGRAVDALSGLVQEAALPEMPFAAHKPLRLRIGREEFTSRQVSAWALME